MDKISIVMLAIIVAIVLDVAYYYATGDLSTANVVGNVLVISGMTWALIGSVWLGLTGEPAPK